MARGEQPARGGPVLGCFEVLRVRLSSVCARLGDLGTQLPRAFGKVRVRYWVVDVVLPFGEAQVRWERGEVDRQGVGGRSVGRR